MKDCSDIVVCVETTELSKVRPPGQLPQREAPDACLGLLCPVSTPARQHGHQPSSPQISPFRLEFCNPAFEPESGPSCPLPPSGRTPTARPSSLAR